MAARPQAQIRRPIVAHGAPDCAALGADSTVSPRLAAGEACLRFGSLVPRPSCLYISSAMAGSVAEAVSNWPQQGVRLAVVTDGGWARLRASRCLGGFSVSDFRVHGRHQLSLKH